MRVITAIALLLRWALLPDTATAQTIIAEARLELPQAIAVAGMDNPACGNPGYAFTAQDLLLKAGAAAIDAALEVPVATPFVNNLRPGDRQWFYDRIGVSRNNGNSTCATQCIVYPTSRGATFHDACLTETGGDGAHCRRRADSTGSWGRVENFTLAKTDDKTIFCATGKNWSHNRNRWFVVRAGR